MRRRHFVLIATAAGVVAHRMKPWLRRNLSSLPAGLDVERHTSQQLRRRLMKHGWQVETSEDAFYVRRPDGISVEIPSETAQSETHSLSIPRERDWVRQLVPRLQQGISEIDSTLKIHDGHKLAYSHEILSYTGDEPSRQSSMKYETDLLIAEEAANAWTPRVVVEAKLGSVTTHDAITYSQKATTHKNVHPYLRYGVFLGNRGRSALPGRLFRHGSHFDFMVSWKELQPTENELKALLELIRTEVEASRLLQSIMFDTRSQKRTRYTLLQKRLICD